jgi:hypothetical protein
MNWCTKYYIVWNEKHRSITLAVACHASSWLELYHGKLLPPNTNHIGILNAFEIYLLCLKRQSHAHYNKTTPVRKQDLEISDHHCFESAKNRYGYVYQWHLVTEILIKIGGQVMSCRDLANYASVTQIYVRYRVKCPLFFPDFNQNQKVVADSGTTAI